MVKFFVKNLWWMIGFWLILIAFFSAPADFYRDEKKASAVVSDSVRHINFNGANDDVIYNLNVPYGYSLNDLQNANILKNSGLTVNSSNQNVYVANTNGVETAKYWYFSDNGGTYTFDTKTLKNLTQWYVFYQSIDNYNDYLGKTVTLVVKVKSISNSGGYRLYYRDTSQHNPYDNRITGAGIYTYTFVVDSNSTRFDVGLRCAIAETTIVLDYFACYVGTDVLPYFNQDYVNQLYVNSGGSISNDFVWSQSPVTYTPFDYANSNFFSTNLYYVRNRQIISFVTSFSNIFENFGTQSSFTRDSVNRVKNIYYKYNGLFNDNGYTYYGEGIIADLRVFMDAINKFVLRVTYIVMLLGALFLLIISPFIDVVVYIVTIITGTIVSWSYIS